MIKGFGVAGYRSFGPSPQFIHPLEKVNLIAGRNNVGKSNVLRLVQLLAKYSAQPEMFTSPSDIEAHRGERRAAFSWFFPFDTSDHAIDEIINKLLHTDENRRRFRPIVEAIVTNLSNPGGNVAWISANSSNAWKPTILDPNAVLASIQRSDKLKDAQDSWYQLWRSLTNSTGGSFKNDHGPAVLARILTTATLSLPKVNMLNAHRRIGHPGTTYQDLNGDGLIARLLELQNPELAVREASLDKFNRINTFLAEVLEVDNARLEVPHSGRELNVSIENKILPIDSLGTGVHEVIIFAAAATSVDNEILCIEEPEIHLHPRLQRQLLRYLYDHTENQYFITTHSACLLDSPRSALFHVTLNEHGESEISRLDMPTTRAVAAFDLGYRASDLVQANSVIWVEGPSDRIYINAWITHAAPNLIEGIHYSIMFYGGRLLSHLTADDPSVSGFISLRRLNRYVGIVIDSDKRAATDPLNPTKQRVLNEINDEHGFAWITAGREIENYVPATTMHDTLETVHPNVKFKIAKTRWDSSYAAEDKKSFAVDKIAVARAAVTTVDLSVLDLKARVEELVNFIKSANS